MIDPIGSLQGFTDSMERLKTSKPLARPIPPDRLFSMEGLTGSDSFVPAPSLYEWISTQYLDEDGALFSGGHAHLRDAVIGCLWTSAVSSRHGRRIVGQAEMPRQKPGNKWSAQRSNYQLRQWFGGMVPDFLLTFDSVFAAQADDATFAALVDHELCHCAQQEDEFGQPRFNKATGAPLWRIRGHDIEEFTSVVERFGIEAAGPEAVEFVIAAAKKPTIGPAKLATACGTCALRAA